MCTQLSTKRLRFHSPVALFKLSRINSIATTLSSDWETDTHRIISIILFEREKKQNPWNNISLLCENVWNFKLRYVWFQNFNLIWMFEFKSSNFLANLWFRMIMHGTAKNQTFLTTSLIFISFLYSCLTSLKVRTRRNWCVELYIRLKIVISPILCERPPQRDRAPFV